MKVLSYDIRLQLFPHKLSVRWMGLFVVTHAFSYGAVEIQDPGTRVKQKVNGHLGAVPGTPYRGGYEVFDAR